jgi:hypothetical protein
MVDQSVREMLGMSLIELKYKLKKINKIEADIQDVVENIKPEETRYDVAHPNQLERLKQNTT